MGGRHITHLLDAEGKEHVKEEDLVPPDDALFLRLLGEPLGPLVGHIGHLEVVLLRHGCRDGLEGGREVVLEQPELHRKGRALRHLGGEAIKGQG